LNRNALVIVALAVFIAFGLISPVSAFYFEFDYFETDKLTYEVGETIHMVAKVTADFSEDGWCYVSFAIVTDSGPVFDDDYFIPPSPNTRILTSSYIILPEHTFPGVNGTNGFVIFNIEAFDGYSQGTSETIGINITRGPLTAYALEPLSVPYGTDKSFDLGIVSAHNSNITLSNSPVSIDIHNSNSELVMHSNDTTDNNGIITVNWNSSLGPPGDYNLTVSCNGTDAFHPLSESHTLTVQPPESSLIVTSHSDSVHCQSHDGSQADLADLLVKHLNHLSEPINDSAVEWSTEFANGNMTSLGNGTYSSTITFAVDPGLYWVNITATNPSHQAAQTSVLITAIQRDVIINVESAQPAVCGQLIVIDVIVTDQAANTTINAIPLSVNLTIGNSTEIITQGATNESGCFRHSFLIPETSWGIGVISVQTNETMHYLQMHCQEPLNISFIPEISHEILVPSTLGYDTTISLHLTDPLGADVGSISVELLNSTGYVLATGTSDGIGLILLQWYTTSGTQVGLENYSLIILDDPSKHVYETTLLLELMTYYPLTFSSVHTMWDVVRGQTATVSFLIESEWAFQQTIGIAFLDSEHQLSTSEIILTDTTVNFTFTIAHNVTLGMHTITVSINDTEYIAIGPFEFKLIVYGTMDADIMIMEAFYGETMVMNLDVHDDNGSIPSSINVSVFVDYVGDPFFVWMNIDPSLPGLIPLPLWINPGVHNITLEVSNSWLETTNRSQAVLIWMRTNLTLTISVDEHGQDGQSSVEPFGIQTEAIAASISSGSIMSPPPILLRDTTPTDSPTARNTSPSNCPKLSSGTSNRSTVWANSLISLSGNGQRVRSLRDLIEFALVSVVMTSSTDLEVQPNETIPHSASEGPAITTSVRRSRFS
jgi:hypothetical protein